MPWMFIRDLQNGETFKIWAHDTPAKIKDEEVWDKEWCTVKEEYIWNDVSDSPVKEEYIWMMWVILLSERGWHGSKVCW